MRFYMFFYWSIYNTCMDPYIPIWHPSAMKCSWLRLLQACICLTWRRVFIRATSINVLPQEACVSLRPWQDKSQAARETAHKDWCKSTSTYIYLHHATEKQCSRLLKQHRLIILILVCVVWLTLRWIGSLLRGSFKHPKQTLRIFQDKGVVPGTAGSWYNTGSKPKKFNAPVILTVHTTSSYAEPRHHASRPDQREWWKLGILWNSQISLWKNIWIPWKNIKQHPFGFWKISNLFHFQAEFGPCLTFMVFMCISNSLYSGLLLAPAASNASLACWKLAATDLPATGKTDVLFLLSL